MPQYIQDALALGQTLSTLGKAAFEGIRGFAEENNIEIEGLPKDPKAEIPPEQALNIVHNFLALSFPLLAQTAPGTGARGLIRSPYFKLAAATSGPSRARARASIGAVPTSLKVLTASAASFTDSSSRPWRASHSARSSWARAVQYG